MGKMAITSILSVTLLLSISMFRHAASANFRGISPQDETYYKASTIWCKDQSKTFTPDQLNDDFCDCPDGTDEPGTSACATGKFYCQNKGHTPLYIFSSRVNDGICDCCDGSDEYEGRIKCKNTCSEASSVWRQKLEKKIATFKVGLEVRKKDVENAKNMIAKEKLELSNLKQEEKKLKDVVQKLKARKEAIEKAEQEEKLKRDKEEAARKKEEEKKREAEEKKQAEEMKKEVTEEKEEAPDESKEIFEEVEDLKDDVEREQKNANENNDEIDSVKETPAEDLSKEELGRLIASRWTGENPNVKDDASHLTESDNHDVHSEDTYDDPNVDDESDQGHEVEPIGEEEEEDEEEYEADHVEDHSSYVGTHVSEEDDDSKESPSLWTKLIDSLKGILNFSSLPVDKLEADKVRKDYQQANSKLNSIRSKISDLEKKLEQDFGKDNEFYSLYGQCFEMEETKYRYKVCPYRNGVQMEGHATTTLGNWDGFKDGYKNMQFSRGDRCWNGPDRSLKVKLRCGAKVELRDVDEPSRCEYVAELSTPAVCLEERLLALQKRLYNQADNPPHDEL